VELRPVKIPQLSDLRESGAIEQDADVVLMMYREDYYEEDTERAGLTDIFIRKHRSGSVGRVELGFKKEQMKFMSLEKARKFEGDFGE
jgi:replicative DNA helicase